MSTNQPVTSPSTIVVPKPRLLPEFVGNIVESINCSSRIILRTSEGTERAVTGIDEITTVMLAQQRQRLLAEYDRPIKTITV